MILCIFYYFTIKTYIHIKALQQKMEMNFCIPLFFPTEYQCCFWNFSIQRIQIRILKWWRKAQHCFHRWYLAKHWSNLEIVIIKCAQTFLLGFQLGSLMLDKGCIVTYNLNNCQILSRLIACVNTIQAFQFILFCWLSLSFGLLVLIEVQEKTYCK